MNIDFKRKIDSIREQADIVEVIEKYIPIVRKGKGYWAVCPFHEDTKPSLSISKDKQIFKCFACNEAGNVFNFVQKYRKIPYIQAVKEVADSVGIEFKIENEKKVQNIINVKSKSLFDICNDACLFYQNSLASSKEASEYCKNRGLDNKTLKDFKIGYSQDKESLIMYLEAKGYSKEDIYKSGIAIDVDGKLIDRFAGRLIFPIEDLNGNVVAFSGRIIVKSDQAKYVNSPETEIFVKGNTLYNYYEALDSIKQQKRMYICEGFMDCIALKRANITNVIALMGTAFTKEHLRIFRFLGVEIVLCLDGDNPGNMNANKLANELLNININVRVVPNYLDVKDGDEYFQKYGKDKLKELVETTSMSAFDFNFYVANKLDLLRTNDDKKKFLKSMCKNISKMSDADIDLYTEKLKNELGFSVSTINALIKENKEESSNDVISAVKKYQKMTKYQELQLRVISNMIDSPEAIQMYIDSFVILEDKSYKELALLISDYYEENKDNLKMDYLIANLYTKASTDFEGNSDILNALKLIDDYKDNLPSFTKESFDDLLYEIKEIHPLEKRILEVNEALKYATDLEEQTKYIKEACSLKEMLSNKLKNKKK